MLLKLFAHLISYVLHPIFMPTLACALLMWCNPYYFAQMGSFEAFTVFSNMIINTIFLPVVSLIILKKMKLLDDFNLPERKQRAVPFLILIFFFFWTFTIFLKEPSLPLGFTSIAFGAFLSLFTAYIINVVYVKVSLHTIGMGAIVATIFYAMTFTLKPLAGIFLLAIIVAGLVGTARLVLGAHTSREVYLGYCVGFLAQVFAFVLL